MVATGDEGIHWAHSGNPAFRSPSISSFEPWTSYYAAYLNRTFAVVEAFMNYPNTLGFFSGNENVAESPSRARQ